MEVAWPAPVRPGDELHVTGRVEQLTPSRSSGSGIARLRFTGRRVADAVVVLDVLTTVILRR